MDLEIEATHSTYEPFDIHVSGEKLENIKINEITKPAASALDRESGYFLETIGDRLIFGFLTEWDLKAGASREGEFFFNIFTLDVENVYDLDLRSLKKELQEIVVENPKNLSKSRVTVSIKNNQVKNEEFKLEFINQWRNYGKARADLSEVSLLISEMPNLIEDIKFISKTNERDEYYNVYKNGPILDERREREIHNKRDEQIRLLKSEFEKLYESNIKAYKLLRISIFLLLLLLTLMTFMATSGVKLSL